MDRMPSRRTKVSETRPARTSLEVVQPKEIDWMEFWLRFTEADERHAEAYNVLDQVKTTARREYPGLRIFLGSVSEGWSGEGGMPVGLFGENIATDELTREAIESYYDRAIANDTVRGRQFVAESRAKTLAAFQEWEQMCASVDVGYGVPALKVAEQEARKLLKAAEARIINTPATDVKGIAVKLALWRRYADEEAPELLSAYRDALRLAGVTEQLARKGEDEA